MHEKIPRSKRKTRKNNPCGRFLGTHIRKYLLFCDARECRQFTPAKNTYDINVKMLSVFCVIDTYKKEFFFTLIHWYFEVYNYNVLPT